MRTTLDIDDDVLFAAKELAAKERKTAGKIISEFVRQAMNSTPQNSTGEFFEFKNGIPVIPSRGRIVTMRQIEKIIEKAKI